MGGTIITLITNQAAFAAVPLSASVMLSCANRDRLSKASQVHHHSLAAVLSEQEDAHQRLLSEWETRVTSLKEADGALEYDVAQLKTTVADLKSIDDNSPNLDDKAESAENFYRRGLSRQRLGNFSAAIADFSEAISLEPKMAGAYHQRGILYGETNRQQAVSDMREASRLYFEQGDLDSYQQARQLFQKFHTVLDGETGTKDDSERISFSSLFT
ncbi:MAG: hypothetical protein AAGG02_16250 [Cyanobacteria bacterium P01_H01_bin.15]